MSSDSQSDEEVTYDSNEESNEESNESNNEMFQCIGCDKMTNAKFCDECLKYESVMKAMQDAESFNQLLSLHLEWIDGKTKGYSYECYELLEDLDGSKQFINLLKYISHKLKM